MPHHASGVTRCAFDLRCGKGTEFQHEWRDAASPYRTGPSFGVVGGQLRVAGKPVLDIPEGVWIHIDIIVSPRDDGKRVWELVATTPGATPQRFSDLPCHPQWRNLEWLGFVSNADGPAVFWLDDLTLLNQP